MSRIALDTNVLVYVAGVRRVPADEDKRTLAQSMLPRLLARGDLVVPVQALGELYNVLARVRGDRSVAREQANRVVAGCILAPSTPSSVLAAIDLATRHRLQIWDALIICVAAEAGCALLLSEDMQDGFAASGVTVVNPFSPTPHPALDAVLADADQSPGSP